MSSLFSVFKSSVVSGVAKIPFIQSVKVIHIIKATAFGNLGRCKVLCLHDMIR